MLDENEDDTLPVSDFKQWVYCPRVWFYAHCLSDIRPTTASMAAGTQAGRDEEGREERRSLRPYGLAAGEREFGVRVRSAVLRLRGEVDMVITTPDEVIPVDYKLSERAGDHFQLQLAAYGAMLEELRGKPVRRGFLYLIDARRAHEVAFTGRVRKLLENALAEMRFAMQHEAMPEPTKQRSKCVSCEFRRFCNDVL
jgi:CRISPR-associated exonuclease Cas4